MCPWSLPNKIDTDADGVTDRCMPNEALDPNAELASVCPPEFPREADTNGDGFIDTCFEG